MTPPDLPLDEPIDDDTLAVHAVVDDEATTEQRRRVARDPELVARVAALRDVVAAVAEPVDPPPADVLARIRRRALDALDEVPAETEPDPAAEDGAGSDPDPAPPLPIRDLATARARRSRSLPPLPAVAAVVILLVVVGVGLLVAGTAGKGESSADGSGGGVQTESGGDSAGGGDDAAAEEAPTVAADEDAASGTTEVRPADEFRDELLARSTARYATQASLEADLRQVDVDTFALSGSAPETGQEDGGEASTTTSAATTAPVAGQASAFAADPVVTRCDTVLRSAEPELEPAIAAVLVEVDGEPVLVLSNPTEVTDQAPSGIRLTVLNAVDCSPRSAVLR